jgi:acyl-homoserine-lactone acylase
MYGGEIEFSGMAIPGMPLPSLGHNRYCSTAMTTGGPDAADCYEEELNPSNPRQYKYDGEWRDMTVKTEVIRVKVGDKIEEKPVELEYTHHGPVAARKDGKAYTLKLPYYDQVTLADQVYEMMTAKNLGEMKKALSRLQLMEQNIMIATVDGDIFYVRNGRVPKRPPGFDYKQPVPGNTSKSEWLGFYALAELLQFHNPKTGYLQNCNVSPQFMAKDLGLDSATYSKEPWLLNGFQGITKAYDNPLHQRAAMCVNLLDANKSLSIDDAIEIAMSPAVYGADVWQKRLESSWGQADEATKKNANAAKMAEVILGWNRRCEPTSTGAVAYRYWKEQIYAADELVKTYDRAGFPIPPQVNDKLILDGLLAGAEKMHKDFGRIEVAYGDVYRVGRKGGKNTWPVGGGSVEGIATPRAIGFDKVEGTPTFLGRGGQTSTQVVLLTKPPKSWTVLPLGNSDRPESKHFDDQAEKLFSQGKMKPTYFADKEELMKHVESTKVLKWDGK